MRSLPAALTWLALFGVAAAPAHAELAAEIRRELAAQDAFLSFLEPGLDPDARASEPLEVYASYATAGFRSEPITFASHRGIVPALRGTLRESDVVALEIGSGSLKALRPPWPQHAFRGIPLPLLVAAHTLAERDHRGLEYDLLLPTGGAQRLALTVHHELDGRVRVRGGVRLDGPWPEVALDPDAAEALTSGRAEAGDRDWAPRERAVLALALISLAPEERARIAGLVFRRSQAAPARTGSGAGFYQHQGARRWIDVYDDAFASDGVRFVGEPDAPVVASAQVILHEIGHALAMARAVEVGRRYEARGAALRALGERFNEAARKVPHSQLRRFRRMRDDLETLKERLTAARPAAERAALTSDVLARFEAVAPDRFGPTDYGQTSHGEAFAEAFALFRLDPAALARVHPGVLAFFQEGRHLEASGTALGAGAAP